MKACGYWLAQSAPNVDAPSFTRPQSRLYSIDGRLFLVHLRWTGKPSVSTADGALVAL